MNKLREHIFISEVTILKKEKSWRTERIIFIAIKILTRSKQSLKTLKTPVTEAIEQRQINGSDTESQILTYATEMKL